MTISEAKSVLHCPDTVGGLYSEKYGEALGMAMEALKREPCEDCISRQAVLDVLDKSKYSNEFCEEHHIDWSINLGMAHIVVNELEPVTPQPKTGHWIEQIDHEENCRTLICSNCDRPALHDGDSIWKHKFCPHCGAKMVGTTKRN